MMKPYAAVKNYIFIKSFKTTKECLYNEVKQQDINNIIITSNLSMGKLLEERLLEAKLHPCPQ